MVTVETDAVVAVAVWIVLRVTGVSDADWMRGSCEWVNLWVMIYADGHWGSGVLLLGGDC